MGRTPKALPDLGDGPAVRTADADAWGITKSRRRRADVTSPHRGMVSIGGAAQNVRDACAAYEAVRLSGQFYSHLTAAMLYGIPLPRRSESLTLHVTVQAPRTAPRRPGVVGHSVRIDELVPRRVGGLPVASPADTWCHLAALINEDDLVAAGDFLVSDRLIDGEKHPPLATLGELTDAARRHRGSRGTKRRAWALPEVRTGVASRPESHLRLVLVRAGLPEPVVAHSVHVERGIVLHPDLAYPRWRLVLEYEGDGHRSDPAQWRRDLRRREMLEAAGWRVMRVTSDDLYTHPAELIARIRHVASTR